jgi:hypothetical protein
MNGWYIAAIVAMCVVWLTGTGVLAVQWDDLRASDDAITKWLIRGPLIMCLVAFLVVIVCLGIWWDHIPDSDLHMFHERVGDRRTVITLGDSKTPLVVDCVGTYKCDCGSNRKCACPNEVQAAKIKETCNKFTRQDVQAVNGFCPPLAGTTLPEQHCIVSMTTPAKSYVQKYKHRTTHVMVSDSNPSVTMNVVVETEYEYVSEQIVKDSIPKELEGQLPKVAALEFKSYDAYRELVSSAKSAEILQADGKMGAIVAGVVALVAFLVALVLVTKYREKKKQPAT